MLSVIDIIRALSGLIETNFPQYPVNDRDINEDFPRPSYFVDVDNIVGENVTAEFVKESAEINIYFFEEDIYSGFLNLLDMKNELLSLLTEPLPLTDENGKTVAHVVFNDVRVEISKADKALRVDMTSELIQGLPPKDEELPWVEELVYNNNFN